MHITIAIIDPRSATPVPHALSQENMYFTSGDIYDWIMDARKSLPANALIGIQAFRDTTTPKPFSTYRGRLDEALTWTRSLPDWAEYAWKEGRGR